MGAGSEGIVLWVLVFLMLFIMIDAKANSPMAPNMKVSVLTSELIGFSAG